MYPYNHKMGQRIQTNAIGVSVDRGFIAHQVIEADDAVAADTNGVHAAVATTTPAIAASSAVAAASDPGDTLTIAATLALGAAANVLFINLTTAEDDNLAVTKDDETKTINIALADTTANKNAAATIQTAVRALTTVGGVDVSEFTCTAGGNWDTAAIATGEAEPVQFQGGQTAANDVITTGITSPAVPRNITATAAGTGGDIKAIQVVIEGTNYANEVITETLPAFTVDTPGTVAGAKAFKTITKITIPPHDGTGATTEIGWGDILGLPYKLAHNTVLAAYLNHTLEGTPPTVAVDDDEIEKNTVDLNSALDGTQVDLYLIV